jgi:hypothetical protein
MADKEFAPVAGDLVISLHKRGVFKVLAREPLNKL